MRMMHDSSRKKKRETDHLDCKSGSWPDHLAGTVNDGLAHSPLVEHGQLYGHSGEQMPLVHWIRKRLRREGVLWLASSEFGLDEVRKALEHMPEAIQGHEHRQDDGYGDHTAQDGHIKVVDAAVRCEGVQQHAL